MSEPRKPRPLAAEQHEALASLAGARSFAAAPNALNRLKGRGWAQLDGSRWSLTEEGRKAARDYGLL